MSQDINYAGKQCPHQNQKPILSIFLAPEFWLTSLIQPVWWTWPGFWMRFVTQRSRDTHTLKLAVAATPSSEAATAAPGDPRGWRQCKPRYPCPGWWQMCALQPGSGCNVLLWIIQYTHAINVCYLNRLAILCYLKLKNVMRITYKEQTLW